MTVRSQRSAEKKAALLELAKSESARPPMTEEIGRALNNYTSESSHSFDATLSETLRATAPHWFKRKRRKAVEA